MYDRLQGVLPQPIGEGTHARIPWVQMPTIMDVRTRPRSITSVTGTKGAGGSLVAALQASLHFYEPRCSTQRRAG